MSRGEPYSAPATGAREPRWRRDTGYIAAMDLDDLPLDVLLAMQDALTDPTGGGAERARLRAAGAGFHVELGNDVGEDGRVVLGRTTSALGPRGTEAASPPPVVPQPEAMASVEAVELSLEQGEPRD